MEGVSSYDGAASFVVGDSAINDLHDLSVVEIAVFDEIPTVCSDVKPRAFILCKLAVAPCEICRTSWAVCTVIRRSKWMSHKAITWVYDFEHSFAVAWVDKLTVFKYGVVCII